MNAPLQGVLATGHDHGVSHLEFTGLDVHHNGTTRLDHGFYVSTPFTVIERSFVHNNSGWGINNYGGDPSHNVFRDNTISDNNRAGGDAAGIGVYTGNDLQLYNNTIVGHFQRGARGLQCVRRSGYR